MITLEKAWSYLNTCTYFAKPYYNDEGIFTFNNEFQEVLFIAYELGKIRLECGSWSLKHKCWYVDYDLTTYADTFEKAVIKLYEKVYKICGEDYIDDYFHVSELDNFKSCLIPLSNGNYTFDSSKINSYWEVDRIMDKIKSFS